MVSLVTDCGEPYLLVNLLSNVYYPQFDSIILSVFVVFTDMMITLLSKGLRLHKYFSADDETSVRQVLLSCTHVSAFNPLKCSGSYSCCRVMSGCYKIVSLVCSQTLVQFLHFLAIILFCTSSWTG